MKAFFGKKETTEQETDIEASGSKEQKANFGTAIINKLKNKTDEITETTQNYQLGLLIMLTGVVFFLLSTIFLPFVLISPYKFIALNSLGTTAILLSIILMKKKEAITFLFSKDTLIFTLLFIISFFFEIYFSTINKRYLFVIIAFVANCISIIYILVSFLRKSSFVLKNVLKGGFNSVKGLFKRAAAN